jgi:hypothetical protein
MRRRDFLRALPPAAVAATAGCGAVDGLGGDDPTDEPRTGSDDPGGPTDFPPSGGDGVERVVWHREADDGAMALEPSSTGGELPDEFTFALENTTDRRFDTNFHSWLLAKRVGGEWYRVAPRFVCQIRMQLPPSERHEWTLTASGELPNPRTAYSGGIEDVSVTGLGGGTYAFAADGWFADEDYEHQTVFAALFDLDGDPVEPVPSDAVRSASRDGDVVTVQADGTEGEDAREATYVLRRVDGSLAEPRPLIPEQVVRRWPLADALAHVDVGVRKVRIEAKTSTHPPFGVQNDGPPVRYGGETFAVSATER